MSRILRFWFRGDVCVADFPSEVTAQTHVGVRLECSTYIGELNEALKERIRAV